MTEITPEVITAFRNAYPLYSDTVTWPDTVVTQALCEGDMETGGAGWGGYEDVCTNFKQRGWFMYAAHYLSVTYPQGASTGNQNAGGTWATQSKSVGDESITYNNGALNNASMGDAWLATTNFGQQYMRLRRRAGMGARAV